MYRAFAALLAAALLASSSAPSEQAPPAEIVGESATLKLQSGQSLVLRTKADIRRTAIAAEGIVELAQLTPREIALVGRGAGTTTLTVWLGDPAQPPVIYAIEVAAVPPAP